MGANPLLSLVPVQTGANEMEDQDRGDHGQDDTLGLELGQAVAFMDIVPLAVGLERLGGTKGVRGRDAGRDGRRRRVGGLVEVGKIWSRRRQFGELGEIWGR